MKVKIVDVGSADAFYENKQELIGRIGELTIDGQWQKGYVGGQFKEDGKDEILDLLAVIVISGEDVDEQLLGMMFTRFLLDEYYKKL